MSRRKQLESMLADDPTDTFLRYALAMELKSAKEFNSSEKYFRDLMKNETPYVPAFFMLGQQLVETDEMDTAKSVLQDGISKATQQKNLHAAGEMSELLQSLD